MPETSVSETPVQRHASTSTKERAFPCHACGADLLFKPGQDALKCTHCGHVEKIPTTEQEICEFSFNDYLAQPRAHGYGNVPGQRRTVRCGGCGATAELDASVRATKCAFCGSPLLTEDNAAGANDIIAPEAIAPFKISVEQANAAFKKWLLSLWFAPNALKQEYRGKQLQGVYRPFWTYDSHTVSHWTGSRGDYYYVTETYTTTVNGKSVTRTRQVRRTRWTYVSGVYSEFFDDVLIKASKSGDKATEYHLSELKPYAPEFLSGFAAERYTVSCETGWKDAKVVIAEEIRAGIRGQIGGDEQRIDSVNTAYSGITYKHSLLPLWISTYKYGAKTYSVQVNGQNGQVSGTRPYSFWKIFLLTVSILALIGGIVLLVQNQ